MSVPTAFENYLKVIYAHTEWHDAPITSGALAARLGLAASTVTEMVKKLVAAGLVNHEPYSAVELTDAGRRQALTIIRRHRLIETWLVTELGYGWDAVHDEAEILEHAVSDRLLNALDDRLGHPQRDPHGDPIPDRTGRIRRPAATTLTEQPEGAHVRVVRIDDRDPGVLAHLAAEGIGLDTPLRVSRVADSAVSVHIIDREVILPTTATEAIRVTTDG